MALTQEDVRWAYRLLLDREPENDNVLATFALCADRAALRNHFLDSREFRQKDRTGHLRLGAFIDAPACDVQVDASPDELRAMLSRIEDAWSRFGESEPHWSVLVNDNFRSANIARSINQFYDTGRFDVSGLLAMAARAGAALPKETRALDFGCGVGRLTFALAERFDHVTGIDISLGHLRLAGDHAVEAGYENVSFKKLGAVDDLGRWAGSFDFVLSRIVLQHNPPPIMAALFGGLLRCLAAGGTALIQMPTYIDGQRFSVADYLAHEQPQMEMNALPQRHVFKIIHDNGCVPAEVREDDSVGTIPGVSQTFVVRKPDSPTTVAA